MTKSINKEATTAITAYVKTSCNGGAAEKDKTQAKKFSVILETKPYIEPVNGGQLIQELEDYFRKYVVLPDGAYQILPYWVLHTYTTDSFNSSPRLLFYSPICGCGKSTALRAVLGISYKGLPVNNITAAAFFRAITEHQPTLGIDEGDTFLKENLEMKNVINSGFERFGYIIRTETVNKKLENAYYKTYSACSIASIGKLADTIMSRSITILMRKKKLSEKTNKLRLNTVSDEMELLRSKCLRFIQDNQQTINSTDVSDINIFSNRQQDIWEPLLIIAKAISPDCVTELLDGIKRLGVTNIADNVISEAEMLLSDIRDILSRQSSGKMFSKHLLNALHGIEAHPWGQINYGSSYLTFQKMAGMLRDFNIAPQSIRIGAENGSGYDIEWFKNVFDTYLPSLSSDTLTEIGECQTVRDKSDTPSSIESQEVYNG